MDGVDPTLLDALAQGTYVVDPAAVAEAMLRRREDLDEARRLSAMFEAAHVGDGSTVLEQHGPPAAGADVA